MDDLDHVKASDEDIIAWCRDWYAGLVETKKERHRLLSANSNIIVKVNNRAVVKYGCPVTASEAANQRFAHKIFQSGPGSIMIGGESSAFRRCEDRAKVTVPQVFRYFETSTMDGRIGYLVMEYIEGRLVTDLPTKELQQCIPRLAEAMQLMWEIIGDKPGPVDNGEARGLIWGTHCRAYECFAEKRDLERWFNRALHKQDTHIDFGESQLVFCHLDIAPRNTLLGNDSILYILDWADAGYYPRSFEFWALRLMMGSDLDFYRPLLSVLANATLVEEDLVNRLWQAYRLNMYYNWSYDLSNITV